MTHNPFGGWFGGLMRPRRRTRSTTAVPFRWHASSEVDRLRATPPITPTFEPVTRAARPKVQTDRDRQMRRNSSRASRARNERRADHG